MQVAGEHHKQCRRWDSDDVPGHVSGRCTWPALPEMEGAPPTRGAAPTVKLAPSKKALVPAKTTQLTSSHPLHRSQDPTVRTHSRHVAGL